MRADDRVLPLDRATRDAVARQVVRCLGAAMPNALAELRGSFAAGRADIYSDIDVLWELPDAQFATGVERLRTILTAIRPVDSLRSDPSLQHSRRRRLVFVRFAGLPLFWRLDLEVFARSVGRDPPCDLAHPGSHGANWSVVESALANAVAAIKAHLRRQDDDANALLARAFQRLGQPLPTGILANRISAVARCATEIEPAVAELAERVTTLAHSSVP